MSHYLVSYGRSLVEQEYLCHENHPDSWNYAGSSVEETLRTKRECSCLLLILRVRRSNQILCLHVYMYFCLCWCARVCKRVWNQRTGFSFIPNKSATTHYSHDCFLPPSISPSILPSFLPSLSSFPLPSLSPFLPLLFSLSLCVCLSLSFFPSFSLDRVSHWLENH